MYKRAIITLSFALVLALPTFAMAQSYGCMAIPVGLSYGSRGTQVLVLQQFIVGQNYSGAGSWMLTGYYGQTTASAVRTFQAYHSLPQTGWVDAATAATIQSASCQGGYYGYGQYPYSTSYTYPYQNGAYSSYPTYNYQYYYPNYGYNQYPYLPGQTGNNCWSGYGYNGYCNNYDTDGRSPVIHATGPSTLDEDEQGSWKIYIDEDNAQDLDLTIDWGDDSSDSKYSNISDRKTVTHRYDDNGSYTIRFKGTDEDDRTFTYTMVVYVENGSSNNDREEVTIDDDAFSPRTIHIDSGTGVTWTNEDNEDHTVTSDNGFFDSGRLDQDDTYSYTFSTQGTYWYHCAIHPEMQGTIIVQ